MQIRKKLFRRYQLPRLVGLGGESTEKPLQSQSYGRKRKKTPFLSLFEAENHTSTTCTLHSILFGSISCSDRKLGLPGHQKEQLRAPKLTPYGRGSNLTLTFNLPVSRCISTYLGGWAVPELTGGRIATKSL